jgi:hypothetical protein
LSSTRNQVCKYMFEKSVGCWSTAG